ncbi:MAG TPA: hypothetical protein VMF91_05365 [Bryobacteraceae bacterium]|nr:hypothetical protein [Bryobacteraceae bacterium]
MANKNLDPLQMGTPVKEVDGTGKPTGNHYLSLGWSTRPRPTNRKDGCLQWIDVLIVSDTFAGAKAGAALLPPRTNVASSSPSSREVTVLHVDNNGQTITALRKPYLFVPSITKISKADADGIANEIWISDTPISTPAVTLAEQNCNPVKPAVES